MAAQSTTRIETSEPIPFTGKGSFTLLKFNWLQLLVEYFTNNYMTLQLPVVDDSGVVVVVVLVATIKYLV